MKTIGIKLADGSFYPVLEEGAVQEKTLDLTTAHNNQTRIMVDLYRSDTGKIDDAEYVDTLQIDNLLEHPNGEPDITFTVSLDKDNKLSAKIVDTETGAQSKSSITLVSRTLEERLVPDSYKISEADSPEVPPKKSGGLLAAAMSLGNNVPQETPASDETLAADSLPGFDAPADVLAGDEPTDGAADDFSVSVTDEIPDDFSGETSVPEDEALLPDDLPDFDDNEFSVPDGEPQNSTDESAAGDAPEEKSAQDETFALPDFDDSTIVSQEHHTAAEPEAAEDDGLPDFDDTEFTTEGLDLDDISLPEDKSEDVQPDNSADLSYSDDFFNFDDTNTDSASAANSSAGGISFTGLYDKETEMGDSSDSENIKKKTKTPVIICVICAIICIIATLLVLFIIPSKYNLISSKSRGKTETEIAESKPVPEQPAEIPEPEPVPKAKEDEVIVIEEAEDVAPEKPVVIPEETKDIVYKIKWGDTLWDIADTYYKNPWRYHRIARYNNIKDPDYIISGTTINIPAE